MRAIVICFKVCDFYADQNSTIATTAGHSLTLKLFLIWISDQRRPPPKGKD